MNTEVKNEKLILFKNINSFYLDIDTFLILLKFVS